MDHKKNLSKDQTVSTDYWKVVPANLKRLIAQNKTSQKRLAQEMNVTESAMSGYCKGKSMPGIEFFVKLKELYGVSIDDFLTKYVTPTTVAAPGPSHDNALIDTYRKYCGSYYVYYLNTSRYKGKEDSSPSGSIIYGVLYIYENPSALGVPAFSCAAVLGVKERETAVSIKKTLDRFTEPTESINYIEKEHGDAAYYGSFDITSDHVFINMGDAFADKALLILHHPKVLRKEYIGGLCTTNSVSKGRKKDPVIQFMGLSRYPLSISAEEIHDRLLLDHPTLTTEDDTEVLIDTVKNLYCEEGEGPSSLSERQKAIIVRSNLEMFIKKSLENNIFRYGKISGDDVVEFSYAKRTPVSIFQQISQNANSISDCRKLMSKANTPLYDLTLVVNDDLADKNSVLKPADVFFECFEHLLLGKGFYLLQSCPSPEPLKSFYLISDNMDNLYRFYIRTATDQLRFLYGNIIDEDGVLSITDVDEIEPRDTYNEKIRVFRKDDTYMMIDKGATVLDFAFHIHGDLGYHFDYAMIDESKTHLPNHTRLNEGDKIIIVANEAIMPDISWFKHVKTSKGTAFLVKYFSKKENLEKFLRSQGDQQKPTGP